MADESTTIHTPSASAPKVTELAGQCTICNFEWVVQWEYPPDELVCPVCGATDGAIKVYSEAYKQGAGARK